MKLKFFDWCVLAAFAAVLVFSKSLIATLLAVISGLLYLIGHRYLSSHKTEVKATPNPDDDEFVVRHSEEQGFVDEIVITVGVGIKYRPEPRHLLVRSRFDLGNSHADYEYKIDGTCVSVRLLNSYDNGESSGFKDEWEVRDGVVLESDIRARWDAQKFKIGDVETILTNYKKQIDWSVLSTWAYNGFVYFLILRSLPVPDARRYLRQELERLKLGNARVTKELATIGIEPDTDPKSIDGWRWIGGKEPEGVDSKPILEKVNSGAFGVSREEVGRSGRELMAGLEKLLGD
jgi:hypothetical protein